MRKTILTMTLAWTAIAASMAQYYNNKDNEPFKHVDLSVTLGTTGMGFDVTTPLSDMVRIRTGFEVMPHFEQDLHFDIQSFDTSGKLQDTQFDQMAKTLQQFTGYKAERTVTMVAKPTFWNFKFLVDVYPFRNKHWHLTAGFHWGPSKIGEAINSLNDSPSLVAVNIYNNIYERALNFEPIVSDIVITGDRRDQLIKSGRMGMYVGDMKGEYLTHTTYATDDEGNVIFDDDGNIKMVEEFVLDENGNKIQKPYRMEPDNNCQVSAKATVNSFRPYLGFGYGGRLLKKDDRYQVSFDAGLMFWGGTPNVITHDGTNLSKDVDNIGGKVGTYVDLISGVKVYPVINLRITRRLF